VSGPRYPSYDVLDKWSSVSFDNVTRGVLRQRMHHPPERRFFDPGEYDLLQAVAARLAPTPVSGETVAIAPWVDAMLFENKGEGFRHDGIPPLQQVWRTALKGLAGEAERRHGRPFTDLGADEQDSLLRSLQTGAGDKALWDGLDPAHVFTHVLLKTVVGVYYSHPAAWSEVGYGGPASPRGYVRIGLNERDPWEAKEAPRDR
jgi:hypothetical protein